MLGCKFPGFLTSCVRPCVSLFYHATAHKNEFYHLMLVNFLCFGRRGQMIDGELVCWPSSYNSFSCVCLVGWSCNVAASMIEIKGNNFRSSMFTCFPGFAEFHSKFSLLGCWNHVFCLSSLKFWCLVERVWIKNCMFGFEMLEKKVQQISFRLLEWRK